jgi:thymidylate synthase (FAD)
MAEPVTFSSDIRVEYLAHLGSDFDVAHAAWVSDPEEYSKALLGAEFDDSNDEHVVKLINYLMKYRHTSPFEHCIIRIFVKVPIMVVREWHRHRTWSYNEMSGRYSVMLPEFWEPDPERPLIKLPGFKPIKPRDKMGPGSPELYDEMIRRDRASCQLLWDNYQWKLEQGVVNEIARDNLPINIYTKFWATVDLNNALKFLSLRTYEPERAAYVSHPQLEIERAARSFEVELERQFPITLAAFNANGRVM